MLEPMDDIESERNTLSIEQMREAYERLSKMAHCSTVSTGYVKSNPFADLMRGWTVPDDAKFREWCRSFGSNKIN